MSPFRILVLGLLCYLFFRLLFGKKKGRPQQTESERQGPAGGVVDVLVEDPVCHVYVAKGQALMLQSGGEPVYFCSEQCRKAFLAKRGEQG